jgi:hypothetical protein
MTNKCTIISQIITLLHVSTLSCHPQTVVINTLPSYASISNAAVGNTNYINPLNAELNPICHLLILLGNLTFMGTCIVSISNKMQR